MFLRLAEEASFQHDIAVIDVPLLAVNCLYMNPVACIAQLDSGDPGDVAKSHRGKLPVVKLALAADTDDVRIVAVHLMLLDQLVEAERVARFQKDERLSFQLCCRNHVFAEVCPAESIVDEILLELLSRCKDMRLRIVRQIPFLPAENADDSAVSEEFFCAVDQFLHLISSNLTFLPRFLIVSANSFMIDANLAPSDAETHSTRTLPLSTPR